MLKFILAFVFLVMIGASFASVPAQTQWSSLFTSSPASCNSSWSCAGEGDSCFGNSVGPVSHNCSLANGTCCATGLWCISGECKTDTLGASCNASTPCFPKITAGYPMQCNNGTCAYLYGPGDTCNTMSDCNYGLNCSSSVCVGATYGQACQGAGFASGCTYGLTCGLNTTSLKMSCMNTTAAGGVCNATTPSCASGSQCYNGTCTAYFSLASGSKCPAGSALCEEDYTCNGTCVAVDDDATSCSGNTDCPNGQTCSCSQFTGDSYCLDPLLNPCTEAQSDLQSCLESSQCSAAGDAPNSCCYNECYSDYKKTFSCGCDTMTDAGGSCAYNPYCGGFPVWAIIVIIVVAIVLVLAVVLLVFFMMRRRRQYDSI